MLDHKTTMTTGYSQFLAWVLSRARGHPAISLCTCIQGDLEKAAALPVSPMFDRNKSGITKSQTGFFDIVVFPLFQVNLSYVSLRQWHRHRRIGSGNRTGTGKGWVTVTCAGTCQVECLWQRVQVKGQGECKSRHRYKHILGTCPLPDVFTDTHIHTHSEHMNC